MKKMSNPMRLKEQASVDSHSCSRYTNERKELHCSLERFVARERYDAMSITDQKRRGGIKCAS
jgi:hypothetical protein